jgi:hypothetical protein
MSEPIPTFSAIIDGVAPKFQNGESERFMDWCETLGNGTEVDVIVCKHRNIRSNQQNAYYWGVVIKMIADHTGEIPERIHGVMADMFLKVRDWLGKERVKSTTELSTVEFEEYAEQCRRWASIALEIYISLPNEAEIPKEYQIA